MLYLLADIDRSSGRTLLYPILHNIPTKDAAVAAREEFVATRGGDAVVAYHMMAHEDGPGGILDASLCKACIIALEEAFHRRREAEDAEARRPATPAAQASP